MKAFQPTKAELGTIAICEVKTDKGRFLYLSDAARRSLKFHGHIPKTPKPAK